LEVIDAQIRTGLCLQGYTDDCQPAHLSDAVKLDHRSWGDDMLKGLVKSENARPGVLGAASLTSNIATVSMRVGGRDRMASRMNRVRL